MDDYHVIFRFGKGIRSDVQGKVMLAAEKLLREMGVPAECFKEHAPDDSKLRLTMTAEKRERL